MNTSNDEDEWEDMIEEAVAFSVIGSNNLLLQLIQMTLAEEEEEDDEKSVDHRTLPRRARRQFKHGEALACINRDYLGPSPLFGKEFEMMFRISRT
jgi:hypothetical protein